MIFMEKGDENVSKQKAVEFVERQANGNCFNELCGPFVYKLEAINVVVMTNE